METRSSTEHSNFEHTAPMFAVVSNTPIFSAEDKLFCIELLQQNLDLKLLMNNFATLVAKFIRPLSVRFQSAHGFFSLMQEQSNNFSRSFNLSLASGMSRVGSVTYHSDASISGEDISVLNELHKLLVPILKHALRFSELNSIVYKDHLTKIGNRAYYEASLQHAIEQCNRTHQGLALMVLDINDFKPINDTFGHLKGDEILQKFSQVLTKSIRTSDMVFRLGGDEFAIILQPAETSSVSKVHQRLLAEITKDKTLIDMNFSTCVGFSYWEIGTSAQDLFELADQSLYQQKALHKANR